MTNEDWRDSYKKLKPKKHYGLTWMEERRIREMEREDAPMVKFDLEDDDKPKLDNNHPNT